MKFELWKPDPRVIRNKDLARKIVSFFSIRLIELCKLIASIRVINHVFNLYRSYFSSIDLELGIDKLICRWAQTKHTQAGSIEKYILFELYKFCFFCIKSWAPCLQDITG